MDTAAHIKTVLQHYNLNSQKVDIFNPNVKDTSKRLFKIKDQEGNAFTLYVFTESISIEKKLNTVLHFSVNLPDEIFLVHNLIENNYGLKIFSDESEHNNIFRCINIIHTRIQQLQLGLQEGLFIYRNGVQLVVDKSRQLIPELMLLQQICSSIDRNFSGSVNVIDPSVIPGNLAVLIPLLQEWAISDDEERSEKINTSSKSKLKKIVDEVSPKMEMINTYLNSFNNEPLPYEATLVGYLAELVSDVNAER